MEEQSYLTRSGFFLKKCRPQERKTFPLEAHRPPQGAQGLRSAALEKRPTFTVHTTGLLLKKFHPQEKENVSPRDLEHISAHRA